MVASFDDHPPVVAPEPLPPELRGRPFRIADAAELGVPRGRMSRRDLHAPHRGVRTDRPALSLSERSAAYLPVLRPGLVFSHATAALLQGMPLPRALEDDDRIHVSAPRPLLPPRARGVVGHQLSPRVGFRAELSGMPVMDAAEAWCELGELSIEALIAAGDHLIRHGVTDPLSVLAELDGRIGEVRRPGASRLREAHGLLRPGTRSPSESWLRAVLVLAGLPEPEVNARIYDDDGAWLGEGDLVYRRARLVLEYEGRHHLTDATQWAIDIRRRERFEDAAWSVLRVTSSDLFRHRDELVVRVARRLGLRPPRG